MLHISPTNWHLPDAKQYQKQGPYNYKVEKKLVFKKYQESRPGEWAKRKRPSGATREEKVE